MSALKKKLQNGGRLLAIIVCLLGFTGTNIVYALTQGDFNSINNNTPFYDPSDSVSGSCSSSTTALVGVDNIQQAFNYLVAKGLTPVQAAAILGNLKQESGVNPLSQQNGSTSTVPINGVGFGIAQWTFTDRQQPLVQLAATENKPVTDLGVQLDYLWQEISPGGNRAGALTSLQTFTDPSELKAATDDFEAKYEGAQNPLLQNRELYAQEIYNQYGGSAVTASSSGATSNSCAAVVNCSSSASGVSAALSTVRQNVVCIAKQELAVWQDGNVQPNEYCKKYINGLGQPGGGSDGWCEEWCADFTSWVYNQAMDPLQTGGTWRIPNVAGIQAVGQANQTFHWHDANSGYTPRPGDIVIHEVGESHVNIVVAVEGTTITMIGGDQGGPNYGGPNSTSVVSEYQNVGYTGDGISGYVSPD